MYESFYRLTTVPFRLTPDPDFCFRHQSYSHAWAYLRYALKQGEGFIVVTGPPGIGKTTLINEFLKELGPTGMVATSVAAVNVEAADLMREVAYSWGINVEGLDKVTIVHRLKQFLQQHRLHGKRALLIIDEAQGLSWKALEELRLLADLQAGSSSLLQVFLVGQEKLQGLMSAPDMEQLQQRVIGTCFLEPLNVRETRAYVEHRLQRAGWHGDPELTGGALLALYQYSNGVPRHINKIGNRLFLYGSLNKKHELDGDDVRTIIDELRAEQLAPLENTQDVPVAVQELEDGSLSLDELALRATTRGTPEPPAPVEVLQETVELERAPPGNPLPVWRGQEKPVDRPPPDPGPGMEQSQTPLLQILDGWPRSAVAMVATLAAVLISTLAVTLFQGRDPGKTSAMLAEPYTELSEKPALAPPPASVAVPAPAPLARVASNDRVREVSYPVSVPVVTQTAHKAFPEQLPEAVRIEQQPPVQQLNAEVAETVTDESDTTDVITVAPTSPAPGNAAAEPGDRVTGGEMVQALPEADIPPTGDPELVEPAVAEPVTVALVSVGTEPGAAAAESSQQENETASETGGLVDERPAQEQEITRLLTRAGGALERNRLMTPADDNAYLFYRKVLELDPGNPQAIYGLDRITGRYVFLARRAITRQDEKRARRFIQRGLVVHPGDRRLLVMQENLQASIQARNSLPPVTSVEEPVQPPGHAGTGQGDLATRLKDFFDRDKATVEKVDIWEEESNW